METTSYNYGAEATVISIINATTGDTNALKVPRALTQAEGLIDLELKPYTTTPVSPAPQVLKDCANDWAAGLCRDEGTNPTSQSPPPNVFIERAKEELCRYMVTVLGAPCPFAPVKTTSGGGGGGGGTVPPAVRYSGYDKSTGYRTDDMQSQWDE